MDTPILAQGAPGTTMAVIYKVRDGRSFLGKVWICNASASARTFTVLFVPSGAAAKTENNVYTNLAISSPNTFEIVGLILPPGAEVRFSASAADVAITVNGLESDL